MSSKNRTKRIPAAATATLDGNDKTGFALITKGAMMSPAFKKLKPSSQMLYVRMLRESKGNEQFEFTRLTALNYGISEATFRRAISDLVENHFITYQSGRTTREPNIFHFRYEWKLVTE